MFQLLLPDLVDAGWVARLGRSSLELVVPADARMAAAGTARAVLGGSLADPAGLAKDLGLEREEDDGDAALVLRAYHRAGDSLLPRLRSAFALVLLDGGAGRSLCVRDPLGVYPLFTAEVGDELLVSPSIEALLAQPGVSREVNVPALADHLLHRWPDLTETYFTKIWRVPPGHMLELDGGRSRLRRYWEPVPLDGPVDWLQEDELDLFDELLERAVARGLTTGPAGIFLSGGLDSVSVAAVAAANARERALPEPLALSLAFPEPDVNEERIQKSVAAELRLPQVLLSWDEAVGPRGLVHAALELGKRTPAPLMNFWAPAYDRLAGAGTNRGCTSILTGSGGDEWLNVTPIYVADLLRTFEFARLVKFVAAQRRSYRISTVHYLRNVVWRYGTRTLLVDLVRRKAPGAVGPRRLRRAETMPEWVAPGADLRRQLVERALTEDRRPPPRTARSHPRFYFDQVRYALNHPLDVLELEETFEQGRRIGARIHAPYWETELVMLLCRTPPELLNRGGRTKGLVRESLARRFPDLGFEAQRKVTAARFATSLLEREAPAAWTAVGGPKILEDAGIVRRGLTPESVLTAGRDPRTMQSLWDILTLEAWLQSRL